MRTSNQMKFIFAAVGVVSSAVVTLLCSFGWMTRSAPAETAANATPSLKIIQRLLRPPNVTGVAWSPDGKKLATFSDYAALITIWDASDWHIIREFRRSGGEGSGQNFTWLPSGQILTSAIGKTLDDNRFSLSLWNPIPET